MQALNKNCWDLPTILWNLTLLRPSNLVKGLRQAGTQQVNDLYKCGAFVEEIGEP